MYIYIYYSTLHYVTYRIPRVHLSLQAFMFTITAKTLMKHLPYSLYWTFLQCTGGSSIRCIGQPTLKTRLG